MKNRDPGLASVFSFLIPGLGQIYNGQMGWGIFHFFLQVALAIIGVTLAFPLISSENGGTFASRLLIWLENPLNMGLFFGVLFLMLANWIWSFTSTATKETSTSLDDFDTSGGVNDIAELVKTARMDFLNNVEEPKIQVAATKEAPSSFSIALYEVLELKGMSPHELADITGLSLQEISRYLQGAQPDEPTINIIARGLNVSPRVLLS